MASNYAEAAKNEKVKSRKEKYTLDKKAYDENKQKFDEWQKNRDERTEEAEKLLIQKPPVEPLKPKEIKDYQKPKVQLAGVKTGTAQQVVWTRRIAIYYVIHLIFQLGLEILGYVYRKWASADEQTLDAPTAFFAWGYFIVPEEYKCDVRQIKGTSSCSLDNEIPCFNPRAFDKTIFLMYHIVMALFSMVLLLCDILYTFQRHIRKAHKKRRKHLQEKRSSSKSGSNRSLKKETLNNQKPSMFKKDRSSSTKLNYW